MAASADGLRRVIDGTSLRGTKIIIGLTLLVFAGQLAATLSRGLGLPLLSGGNPADSLRFGALLIAPGAQAFEPSRLLSAVFVHYGLVHIGLNLLALVQLSRAVEPAIGTSRYLIAYVTTGIVGFATTTAYVLITGSPPMMFTAGASGAIFGVMGLILGWMIRRRDPRWRTFAVEAVFFSVLLGFGLNATGSGVVVNNSAHLGGLVCGVLFGVFYASPRARRSDLWVNVGAAVALAACVASLVLAQRSPVTRRALEESASTMLLSRDGRPERPA
jgi:membrane associated rhomboid family serine protease